MLNNLVIGEEDRRIFNVLVLLIVVVDLMAQKLFILICNRSLIVFQNISSLCHMLRSRYFMFLQRCFIPSISIALSFT